MDKNTLKNQIEYYANLPYTVLIEKEDNGHGVYYVARVVELPDLIMTGDTPEEAVAELESEKREWIEAYLKLGNKMPRPLKSRRYSGKVILRMPPSLHEDLVKIAELEGVSFNQYMVSALSKTVGKDQVIIESKSVSSRSRKSPVTAG